MTTSLIYGQTPLIRILKGPQKAPVLTLSLPNVAKGKFRPNLQISFSKILTNKQHHVKVQAESFHLNGHIIGFRPQTQKLESPYKTPSNTLAVKGVRWLDEIFQGQYLPSLSINYVAIHKDLEKLPSSGPKRLQTANKSVQIHTYQILLSSHRLKLLSP